MGLHKDITENIIAAAIEVHRHTGPGLLQSVYAACLFHELAERGIRAEREVALPVRYKNVSLDSRLRLDLIVEKLVVVEIKSVESIHPIHEAQLLTYLKLSSYEVGLIINFNVRLLRDGIVRRALSKDMNAFLNSNSASSALSAVNSL